MKRDEASPVMEGAVCPVPLAHDETVVMGHGSGGRMTHDLVQRRFQRVLGNPALEQGDDAAVLPLPEGPGRLAITTDAHIVAPLFFPGGDIGRLAVCGTVNDLAVMGAKPLWLTAAFILEEGLPLATLDRVIESMRAAAEEAGVVIVAGDTKVAERGKADGLFISTAGVGWVPQGREASGRLARPGDAVLVSGPLGDHGIAVLEARGGLGLASDIVSDVAPIHGLVEALFEACRQVHVLRDPTRGGVATTLNEIARQSGVGIELDESAIPVRPAVQSACELLGMDPLYVANEGRLVAMVGAAEAEVALQALRRSRYGEGAARIGTVLADPPGRVLMRTAIGGTRLVDMLAGEMLPRIC
jgi:hydrogenase expression/formation protein HypE